MPSQGERRRRRSCARRRSTRSAARRTGAKPRVALAIRARSHRPAAGLPCRARAARGRRPPAAARRAGCRGSCTERRPLRPRAAPSARASCAVPAPELRPEVLHGVGAVGPPALGEPLGGRRPAVAGRAARARGARRGRSAGRRRGRAARAWRRTPPSTGRCPGSASSRRARLVAIGAGVEHELAARRARRPGRAARGCARAGIGQRRRGRPRRARSAVGEQVRDRRRAAARAARRARRRAGRRASPRRRARPAGRAPRARPARAPSTWPGDAPARAPPRTSGAEQRRRRRAPRRPRAGRSRGRAAPAALDGGGEVAQVVEPEARRGRGRRRAAARRCRRRAAGAGCAGRRRRRPPRRRARRARAEERDQPVARRAAPGTGSRSATAPLSSARAAPAARARAARAARSGEDLAHRGVELAHAAKAGGERHLGDRQRRGLEQDPRGLGALRTRERQRPGADDRRPAGGARGARCSPRRAASPRDALAVDDAVGDQAHRAARRGRRAGPTPASPAWRRGGSACTRESPQPGPPPRWRRSARSRASGVRAGQLGRQ